MRFRLIPSLLCLLLLPLHAEPAGKTTVACVGDSITFGSGAKDRSKESYPAVLQTLLGDDHVVRNFGVGGSTLLRQGDKPYFKQNAHAEAMALKSDIYVVKLGTNDTKPQNWKHKDQFEADARALVGEIRAANPKARVFLCTPVPAYPGNFGISDAGIREVGPLVRKVAESEKTMLIDLYTPLSGHPEFFPDKVHPNAAGYKVLAGAVYEGLTGKKAPAH